MAKSNLGGKDSFNQSIIPYLRENRAGVQGKDLEARTEAETMEEHTDLLAWSRSATFLIKHKTACPWVAPFTIG